MQNLNIHSILPFIFIISLYGCSSTSSKPVEQPMPYNDIDSISFNLNQLKGEKELFVVFFKDNDGVPTSIKNITPKLEKALSYFKDDSSINISDCIRQQNKIGNN